MIIEELGENDVAVSAKSNESVAQPAVQSSWFSSLLSASGAAVSDLKSAVVGGASTLFELAKDLHDQSLRHGLFGRGDEEEIEEISEVKSGHEEVAYKKHDAPAEHERKHERKAIKSTSGKVGCPDFLISRCDDTLLKCLKFYNGTENSAAMNEAAWEFAKLSLEGEFLRRGIALKQLPQKFYSSVRSHYSTLFLDALECGEVSYAATRQDEFVEIRFTSGSSLVFSSVIQLAVFARSAKNVSLTSFSTQDSAEQAFIEPCMKTLRLEHNSSHYGYLVPNTLLGNSFYSAPTRNRTHSPFFSLSMPNFYNTSFAINGTRYLFTQLCDFAKDASGNCLERRPITISFTNPILKTSCCYGQSHPLAITRIAQCKVAPIDVILNGNYSWYEGDQSYSNPYKALAYLSLRITAGQGYGPPSYGARDAFRIATNVSGTLTSKLQDYIDTTSQDQYQVDKDYLHRGFGLLNTSFSQIRVESSVVVKNIVADVYDVGYGIGDRDGTSNFRNVACFDLRGNYWNCTELLEAAKSSSVPTQVSSTPPAILSSSAATSATSQAAGQTTSQVSSTPVTVSAPPVAIPRDLVESGYDVVESCGLFYNVTDTSRYATRQDGVIDAVKSFVGMVLRSMFKSKGLEEPFMSESLYAQFGERFGAIDMGELAYADVMKCGNVTAVEMNKLGSIKLSFNGGKELVLDGVKANKIRMFALASPAVSIVNNFEGLRQGTSFYDHSGWRNIYKLKDNLGYYIGKLSFSYLANLYSSSSQCGVHFPNLGDRGSYSIVGRKSLSLYFAGEQDEFGNCIGGERSVAFSDLPPEFYSPAAHIQSSGCPVSVTLSGSNNDTSKVAVRFQYEVKSTDKPPLYGFDNNYKISVNGVSAIDKFNITPGNLDPAGPPSVAGARLNTSFGLLSMQIFNLTYFPDTFPRGIGSNATFGIPPNELRGIVLCFDRYGDFVENCSHLPLLVGRTTSRRPTVLQTTPLSTILSSSAATSATSQAAGQTSSQTSGQTPGQTAFSSSQGQTAGQTTGQTASASSAAQTPAQSLANPSTPAPTIAPTVPGQTPAPVLIGGSVLDGAVPVQVPENSLSLPAAASQAQREALEAVKSTALSVSAVVDSLGSTISAATAFANQFDIEAQLAINMLDPDSRAVLTRAAQVVSLASSIFSSIEPVLSGPITALNVSAIASERDRSLRASSSAAVAERHLADSAFETREFGNGLEVKGLHNEAESIKEVHSEKMSSKYYTLPDRRIVLSVYPDYFRYGDVEFRCSAFPNGVILSGFRQESEIVVRGNQSASMQLGHSALVTATGSGGLNFVPGLSSFVKTSSCTIFLVFERQVQSGVLKATLDADFVEAVISRRNDAGPLLTDFMFGSKVSTGNGRLESYNDGSGVTLRIGSEGSYGAVNITQTFSGNGTGAAVHLFSGSTPMCNENTAYPRCRLFINRIAAPSVEIPASVAGIVSTAPPPSYVNKEQAALATSSLVAGFISGAISKVIEIVLSRTENGLAKKALSQLLQTGLIVSVMGSIAQAAATMSAFSAIPLGGLPLAALINGSLNKSKKFQSLSEENKHAVRFIVCAACTSALEGVSSYIDLTTSASSNAYTALYKGHYILPNSAVAVINAVGGLGAKVAGYAVVSLLAAASSRLFGKRRSGEVRGEAGPGHQGQSSRDIELGVASPNPVAREVQQPGVGARQGRGGVVNVLPQPTGEEEQRSFSYKVAAAIRRGGGVSADPQVAAVAM